MTPVHVCYATTQVIHRRIQQTITATAAAVVVTVVFTATVVCT
jgi:hypothetical protein